MYINFLTYNISSHTKIFADDLKLYISVETTSCNAALHNIYSCQRDITRLHKAASSWGLSMNINDFRDGVWTCQIYLPDMYYLNGIPIPVKDSAMDLGVNIDSTLKFHQHKLSRKQVVWLQIYLNPH